MAPYVPAATDVPLPPKPKPLVPLTPFSAPKKKPVLPAQEKVPESEPQEKKNDTDASAPEKPESEAPANSESSDAATPTEAVVPAKRVPISNLSKRPTRIKPSKPKAHFRPPPKPGSEYTIPFWSAIPEHAYKLEVLKAGSIRSVMDINLKTHYTFGRLATCDIVMEHQSVSRKHAVIQFRDNSTVYLYDLGSTHGSFINKRRIPPHIYTELKVGDLISFGASTRRYILDGPEALRPQGQRQIPLLLDADSNPTTELPTHFVWQEDEAQGVTWGVGAAVETAIQKELEQEQERANRKWEKTDTMSDRQKKLLERMELREKKIANIRTEMANLQAKQERQNGELTEGQKARIAQCEGIIEKLEEQKESLRETIHDSFEDAERRGQKKPADNSNKKKRRLNDFSDSEEEDEFYDRTQHKPSAAEEPSSKKKPAEPARDKRDPLTVARAGFKAAQMELDHVESRIFKLNLQLRDFGNDDNNEQDDDALDAFMAGITDAVKKDKRREIEEELKKLQIKKLQCETELKGKQAALVQAEYTQSGSLDVAKQLKAKHEEERKETRKREEIALVDKTQKPHKQPLPEVPETVPAESPATETREAKDSPSVHPDTKESAEKPSVAKEGEEGTGEDAELARIRARIEAQRNAQKVQKKKQAADATLAFVRLGKEKQAERERAKEEKERLEMEQEAAAAAAEKQRIMAALEEEEKRKAADPLERMRSAFDKKRANTIAPDDEFIRAQRAILQARLNGQATEDTGISAGLHLRKKAKEAPAPAALEFAPPVNAAAPEEKLAPPPPRPYNQDLGEEDEVTDVTWVPPVGQRGDGKTHLNAKFGY